jgi:hypothetical protein
MLPALHPLRSTGGANAHRHHVERGSACSCGWDDGLTCGARLPWAARRNAFILAPANRHREAYDAQRICGILGQTRPQLHGTLAMRWHCSKVVARCPAAICGGCPPERQCQDAERRSACHETMRSGWMAALTIARAARLEVTRAGQAIAVAPLKAGQGSGCAAPPSGARHQNVGRTPIARAFSRRRSDSARPASGDPATSWPRRS